MAGRNGHRCRKHLGQRRRARFYTPRTVEERRACIALGADETEAKDFLMYADYAEPVHRLPPHRILALNRGENKGLLKVSLKYPTEVMTEKLARKLKIQQHTVWTEMYTAHLPTATNALFSLHWNVK